MQCVYIAPLKALVRERVADWRERIERRLGRRVVELTGDVHPDLRALRDAALIVTTPEKWDGVSRAWHERAYVQSVRLIVVDEIHLLGTLSLCTHYYLQSTPLRTRSLSTLIFLEFTFE